MPSLMLICPVVLEELKHTDRIALDSVDYNNQKYIVFEIIVFSI